MAQDYSEQRALKLARETVMKLEGAYPGDLNKVLGNIMKMQENKPLSAFPTADEIFNQRVAELSREYAKVSDGAGGTHGASKQAMASYKNVLAGKMPDGHGFALSQRVAMLAGKPDHLVEGIKMPKNVLDVMFEVAEDGARGVAKGASKFGIGGKAIGAAAGVAVTLAGGNASAAQVGEAALNGVSNGLGTLVIGEGSGRNRLCQIFGDVVVPGAIGVGTGLVATPVAGMAAGTAASVALSEPSTAACNNFAQKFGL